MAIHEMFILLIGPLDVAECKEPVCKMTIVEVK